MRTLCVYGAGAVGQFLVATLCSNSRRPLEVAAVCRGSTYERLARTGQITLDDHVSGTVTEARGFRVVDDKSTASLGPQDYVISCVKGHQLPACGDSLKPLVGPRTVLIILQNGLPFYHNDLATASELQGVTLRAADPEGVLAHAFPISQLAGCVSKIAVARNGDKLDLTSSSKITTFMLGAASRDDPELRDKLQSLADVLQQCGVNSYVEDDLMTAIWRKVLISASVNTTNMLTHGYADDLIADPAMADLVTDIMEEVAAVGRAAGAALAPDEHLQIAAWLKKAFGRSKFSMLQDVEAGNSVEVKPYVTAVLEVAERLGLVAPKLSVVAALVGHYRANLERAAMRKHQ